MMENDEKLGLYEQEETTKLLGIDNKQVIPSNPQFIKENKSAPSQEETWAEIFAKCAKQKGGCTAGTLMQLLFDNYLPPKRK
jgi:hypothetical protein